MLQRLLDPRKEDICPNCGTACFATDVLCPNCGKNLDELYESLPSEWTGAKPILHIRPEHGFVAMWVAATAIGMAVGEVSWIQWGWLMDLHLYRSAVELGQLMYALESELATGIIVGTLQWVILRNRISHSWQWIISTTLGMVGAVLAEKLFSAVADRLLPRDIGELGWWIEAGFVFFFGGVALGFIQWLALRKLLQGAWRWIILTGVSWSLGFILSTEILMPIFYPQPPGMLIQYGPSIYADAIINGSRGMVIGICTGLLLLWLLQQNGIGLAPHNTWSKLSQKEQSQSMSEE